MTESVPRRARTLPPATLGVLGGGQLGRYFVMAARTLGYRTIVLEPDPGSPAGAAADVHLAAAYDDPAALKRLAAECAVVTTEFENPPAEALAWLAERTAVHPSPAAIAIAQDRIAEKTFLGGNGFPVGTWAPIVTGAEPPMATPAILKTSRLGYDGKGQLALDRPDQLVASWQQLGAVPCVLERRLDLERELSVILARSASGETAVYPIAANTHVDGILDLTVVPVDAPGAADLALAIAETLDYVGVLAVELFVVDGSLLVNELAPRPHNSGHWTLDAARTSQFEQQVRAICGLPLGNPGLSAPAAAMANLLGDLWACGDPDWHAALADPHASLHLYGKAAPRAGRKMGHLTVTAASATEAAAIALALRAATLRGS